MSDENDDIEEEDAEGEEGKKKGLPKIVLFGGLGGWRLCEFSHPVPRYEPFQLVGCLCLFGLHTQLSH